MAENDCPFVFLFIRRCIVDFRETINDGGSLSEAMPYLYV